jgi:transcriptional regulator with XRE-family HTH domain
MPMPGTTRVTIRRDVIVRARLARGWTKGRLAAEARVPNNAVSRVEGGGPVGPKLIFAIGQALGLAIDDFVIVDIGEPCLEAVAV